MKKVSLLFILVIFTNIIQIHAQDADKTVTITVNGSGKTQDEAKQSALRTAIERTFGAFISSKTEMLNDQVVADQMASVSSGNIKNYELLNESQLPDGSWSTTIKAIVSVSKLANFVQSKGGNIEFKGELFALNIKQQMLNETGEIAGVFEVVGLINNVIQTAFDFSIKSSNPKAMDNTNQKWSIPMEILVRANKNMSFCAEYIMKTLGAIGMANEEIQTYRSLNKAIYTVTLSYQNKPQVFSFRSEYSEKALQALVDFQNLYFRSYKITPEIKNGFNEFNEKALFLKAKSYEVETEYGRNNYRHKIEKLDLTFSNAGQLIGQYTFNDHRSLNEIEQLSNFNIEPTGKELEYRNGGFVIGKFKKNEIILCPIDLGSGDIKTITEQFNNLNIGGYHDWVVPSAEILEFCDNWAKKKSVNLFRVPGGLVTKKGERFLNSSRTYISSNANEITCTDCNTSYNKEAPTIRLVRLNQIN